MTEFDPASHRMVPEQRWFEDFVLGERFVMFNQRRELVLEGLQKFLIRRRPTPS